MVFVTGDTHGRLDDFLERFEKPPKPDDIVIVAGDFGFIWGEAQKPLLKKLSELPFTVAFVDGNHENFPAIYKYPVENWSGGQVHRIADNIVHLMRGQLFTLEAGTFFTLGGAYSIDKAWRTEGTSWWKEELPDSGELDTARITLENAGNKADYIITHTCPDRLVNMVCAHPDFHDMPFRLFLQDIADTVDFKHWYFGHYHDDRQLSDKFTLLYHSIVVIE